MQQIHLSMLLSNPMYLSQFFLFCHELGDIGNAAALHKVVLLIHFGA